MNRSRRPSMIKGRVTLIRDNVMTLSAERWAWWFIDLDCSACWLVKLDRSECWRIDSARWAWWHIHLDCCTWWRIDLYCWAWWRIDLDCPAWIRIEPDCLSMVTYWPWLPGMNTYWDWLPEHGDVLTLTAWAWWRIDLDTLTARKRPPASTLHFACGGNESLKYQRKTINFNRMPSKLLEKPFKTFKPSIVKLLRTN